MATHATPAPPFRNHGLSHIRPTSYQALHAPTSSPSSSRLQSPTPRPRLVSDDFLALLSPAIVLQTLRAPPSGPLKTCLDAAAISDRDLALRAATASNKVHEWLNELSQWVWPAGPGSAGFEQPVWGRGRLFTKGPSNKPDAAKAEYWGSLQDSEVRQREAKVDDIVAQMDDLRLEELKTRVLHDHILPLSRPGTPLSAVSLLPYNHMDDLTAVVTAVVVQALPNISRLSRLLRIWAIRLAVLHRIPALLSALTEAEIGLRVGWNSLSMVSNIGPGADGPHHPQTTFELSRQQFDVMRRMLATKVTRPGAQLDRMLDTLEGLEDTLPEAWLDRMEAIEKDFGEWVVAGERIIRETEWTNTTQDRTTSPKHQQQQQDSQPSSRSSFDGSSKLPLPVRMGAGAHGIPTLSIPSSDDDGGVLLPPIHMGGRSVSDSSDASTVLRAGIYDLSTESPHTPHSPRFAGFRFGDGSGNSSQPGSPVRFGAGSASSPPRLHPAITDDSFSPSVDGTFAQIDEEDEESSEEASVRPKRSKGAADDQLRKQISEILRAIPGGRKFKLSSDPELGNASNNGNSSNGTPYSSLANCLNPPDLVLPRLRKPSSREHMLRSKLSASSLASSRAPTPSYTLTPAPFSKNPSQARRANRGHQETKVYHLSRSNGGAPIKLFIRTVGENGERVMVRVGGGWADLGEYLKEYATHHGRRSTSAAADKVEIRDLPAVPPIPGSAGRSGSSGVSPPRPTSSAAHGQPTSPMTPLVVRKKRRGSELPYFATPSSRPGTSSGVAASLPRTPAGQQQQAAGSNEATTPGLTPSTAGPKSRSRTSSASWGLGEDSDSAPVTTPAGATLVPPIPSIALGLAGPMGRRMDMSEENMAWVESVTEKVRLAGNESRRAVSGGYSGSGPGSGASNGGVGLGVKESGRDEFGDMGRVGGTKRVFRKGLIDEARK